MSTDDKLNGILKQSASVLNLKPHLCGRFTENSTMMYTACDTEGHLGHVFINFEKNSDIL